MERPKRFVYILKSISSPAQYYVGATSDPASRLEAHNAGLSPHTAQRRPWRNLVVIEFDEEEPALRFERYLRTGSGREFARRHFRQSVGLSLVPYARRMTDLRTEKVRRAADRCGGCSEPRGLAFLFRNREALFPPIVSTMLRPAELRAVQNGGSSQ